MTPGDRSDGQPDGTPDSPYRAPSVGSGLPAHLDPRGPRRSGRGAPPPRPAVPPVPAGTGPGSSVLPRRPRRRSGAQRVVRVLSWLSLSLAVLILFVAAAGYALINHYNGQITHENIAALPGFAAPSKSSKAQGAANYLLVGDDDRVGANADDGAQGTGINFVTGQRSDTIILAHLYGGSNKVQMVSFPRDSRVLIPRYTDPKTGHVTPAHENKINSAFSEGGPSLLIATVEGLTNIKIDHFLQIDFTGFKRMTDELGGVNICITKAVDDKYTGLKLTAGEHHISGETALAFVRQRHGLANGDLDRIARQQQFIGAMAHKVLSAQTLFNPIKLNGFLDAATNSLKVDKGFNAGDLKNLALRMRGFSSGNVVFTSVPVATIDLRVPGDPQSYVGLDETAMAAQFAALRDDKVPGTVAVVAKPKLTVAPSAIRVAVVNSSGTVGLGRTAASDLTGVGFVVGTPTTGTAGVTATTVYYGPDRADSAKTLAAAVPGSVMQLDPSLGRSLELVVGTSYHGAVKVTVTPSAPTTTSTDNVTPATRTAADTSCTA